MGVSVGPGRGSAAGSAVAYCVGITNVDPIKYNLLFERFLNPDRVSLPWRSLVIGADGFGFAPNNKNQYTKIIQIGNVVIEDNVEIGANTTIDRATMGSTTIRKGVKLDNLIQIAHNV